MATAAQNTKRGDELDRGRQGETERVDVRVRVDGDAKHVGILRPSREICRTKDDRRRAARRTARRSPGVRRGHSRIREERCGALTGGQNKDASRASERREQKREIGARRAGRIRVEREEDGQSGRLRARRRVAILRHAVDERHILGPTGCGISGRGGHIERSDGKVARREADNGRIEDGGLRRNSHLRRNGRRVGERTTEVARLRAGRSNGRHAHCGGAETMLRQR